jgi:hypothetical protein
MTVINYVRSAAIALAGIRLVSRVVPVTHVAWGPLCILITVVDRIVRF